MGVYEEMRAAFLRATGHETIIHECGLFDHKRRIFIICERNGVVHWLERVSPNESFPIEGLERHAEAMGTNLKLRTEPRLQPINRE